MTALNLQVRMSSTEPWSTLNRKDFDDEASYTKTYAELILLKDDWLNIPEYAGAMFRIISDKRLVMEQEREAHGNQAIRNP